VSRTGILTITALQEWCIADAATCPKMSLPGGCDLASAPPFWKRQEQTIGAIAKASGLLVWQHTLSGRKFDPEKVDEDETAIQPGVQGRGGQAGN